MAQEATFEGLNLPLLKPQSHQWSLNFAISNDGSLTEPRIGEFKNGRGEFLDQEKLHGRTILLDCHIGDNSQTPAVLNGHSRMMGLIARRLRVSSPTTSEHLNILCRAR